MSSILVVVSSPAGDDAYTTRAALLLADRLAEDGGSKRAVVTRDVASPQIPHVDEGFIDAMLAPPKKRNAAQEAELELSRSLARELFDAQVIIIGSPMINLGMPSTLKAWFDRLLVRGVTFEQDEGGPVGGLGGRKVVLIEARVPLSGGDAEAIPDFQTPLMKHLLAKMGLVDVTCLTFDIRVSDPGADLERFDASLKDIVRRLKLDLRLAD